MAASSAEAPKQAGVVRGTLQYAGELAWGVYSQAEQISVVKATMDMAKPVVGVVSPVVQSVVAAADPWVDSVDSVVTGAVNSVNSNVVAPITVVLQNRYENLVDLSDYVVDTCLPEEKDEHAKSLVGVSSKASKRVMTRLGNGWNGAKAFSSGTLKEIIHVDLIDTAANGFSFSVAMNEDEGKETPSESRGAAVAGSVKSAFVSVRDISAEKSKVLYDKIKELSEKAKESNSEKVALVTLKVKEKKEQFVVAEHKLLEVMKTELGVIKTEMGVMKADLVNSLSKDETPAAKAKPAKTK